MNFKSKSRSAVAAARGLAVAGLCVGTTLLCAGAAAADPLATPAILPPLAANANPFSVDTGPLGKVYISGALTGLGLVESHNAAGEDGQLDLSNAQVIIQNTSGPVQFYVQAGQYSQPFLGVPYMKSVDATKANFGNVPIAYLKFQITPEISIQAGKLYPLIGNETTFTFQNTNVFRGLLVIQEPALSRGVQVNYSKGKLNASLSLNDGFYSNKLNWITGLVSYAVTPQDTIVLSGGGAFSQNSTSLFTTPPAQNNGWLMNLIWTHTQGPWMVSPYFQYSHTPALNDVGINRSASTIGGAVLAKYSFTPAWSVAGRAEYISSSSDDCPVTDPTCVQTSLMFGPNSKAWSLTVTPTWQHGIFFVRGEISYTQITNLTPGFGFGSNFDETSQTRGVIETGVLF
jgi:hypothetical protein